jgi:hypothetical protein
MRVGFTGGRNYSDRDRVRSVVQKLVDQHGRYWTAVHGGASGADRLVSIACKNLHVEEDPYPADWDGPCDPGFCAPDHRKKRRDGTTYCPAAGPRRNQEMVDTGLDLLIVFPGNKGTQDMMRRAHAAHVPIWKVGE